MTPEREKLIRDHWRMWRGRPPEGGVLRVAVCKPIVVTRAPEMTSHETLDVLEFRREYGTSYGRKAMRVTCEGVVLETVVE